MAAPAERDAHFLHSRRPLEPVLVAPVESPRALSWMARRELLLVASKDGRVHAVEPAFGTRVAFAAAPEPVHLSTHGDDVYVFSRSGRVERWSWERNERLWAIATGLVGNQGIRVSPGGIALIGDDGRARRQVVCLSADGAETARLPAPARAALGVDDEGDFVLARSTEERLCVQPLGEPWLEPPPATAHGLRFARGEYVLGIAAGGVTVWRLGNPSPRTLRLPATVSAALHSDGHTLGLGTREGAVAIGDVDAPAQLRARPARVDAHRGPVRAISFSTRGRWLASVADRCRVWAY